ncbi:cucumopine synthase [Aspergillus homomorphus CBS 101889]|uniref:Cucumopine synthase n=1 Tax=Aspergillus homomorphus (strain CBS 101889) TaxID=1450537 RepID=A0A395HXG5_ASPHC|nr:cucumopine synthase [Aspergillus homomorphus CBS 101889]RAL12611.1 cucumopine synthase [Aspergillus homomorphus CBS 101889]
MALLIKSSSPRRVKVKWPQLDITISVEMNEGQNSHVVDLFFESLPYRSLQNHALVSGDHLYHLVPCEKLIYTHADYKHLEIKYGPLTEYLPAAPCGRVLPEDMDSLRAAGNGVWKACHQTKQIIGVIIWDARQVEPTEHLPLRQERFGVTDEVKALVRKIHDETEKSWSGISDDLRIAHNGMAPSCAGSKGSYFATMVFINGEIRPLGYNVVFASVPSEFVGYTGASFLCMTNREIADLIKQSVQTNPDHVVACEDFLALISAFGKYVNLLNAQNLCLFPWRHSTECPIALNKTD